MTNHFYSLISPICNGTRKEVLKGNSKLTAQWVRHLTYVIPFILIVTIKSILQVRNLRFQRLSHLLWHITSMIITMGFSQSLLPKIQENRTLYGLSSKLNVGTKERKTLKKKRFRALFPKALYYKDVSGCHAHT